LEDLIKNTKKPIFLQIVGVEHLPYQSNMSTLAAELEKDSRWRVQTYGALSTPDAMKWMSLPSRHRKVKRNILAW
jgi:hypothetical protein